MDSDLDDFFDDGTKLKLPSEINSVHKKPKIAEVILNTLCTLPIDDA